MFKLVTVQIEYEEIQLRSKECLSILTKIYKKLAIIATQEKQARTRDERNKGISLFNSALFGL